MPVIYCAHYTPVSSKISEIAAQEHMLGQRLLHKGLDDLYGIHIPIADIKLYITTDTCGKPRLIQFPHIHFNITHCSGLVACAFHNVPIGIDAELPDYFPPILIQRALSESEKKLLATKGTNLQLEQEWFYRFWTLKEAYVKKSGQGVDTDLTAISFSIQEIGDKIQITCSDPSTICYQSKLNQNHILSLCWEKTQSENTSDTSLVFCDFS